MSSFPFAPRGPRSPRPALLRRAALVVAAPLLVAACGDDYEAPTPPAEPLPQPTAVVNATGDVNPRVLEFRALLGEPGNGAAVGQQPAGRREVAWDGAGARPFNNRNDFPADFFNTNATNGVVFTTPGTGFRNDSTRFVELEPSHATQFNPFSAPVTFAPVGSPVMDVHFRVAGAATPAAVTGFGAVFSDVDLASTAQLEYFDAQGRRLAVLQALPRSDAAGLSFAGLRFAEPIVARVRITAGAAALGPGVKDLSAGGTHDLVVLDNFLYGEPNALPPG